MALTIIEDERWETVEEYRLCFSLADAPGCGWSFPCDADGDADEAALHPEGLDNLRMCRTGQDGSGRTIVRDGVLRNQRVVRHRAVALCSCGARLELESSRLNHCDNCHRDFNGGGQELTSRHHWGEETGEHWADLVALAL